MKPIDLVIKIGSMALIQKEDNVIDYNVFQRLGNALRPGMLLVTSGAAEIGRLDYIQRTGCELGGMTEQDKVDYSAQGQTILMNTYRSFIRPEYGVRQVLVEHNHFNDPQRREHIRHLLAVEDLTSANQAKVPSHLFAVCIRLIQTLRIAFKIKRLALRIGMRRRGNQRNPALRRALKQRMHGLRRIRTIVHPPEHMLMQICKTHDSFSGQSFFFLYP